MEERPLFYPLLGAIRDFGFLRISGAGLGNSFYSYFHALVLAKANNGALIHPAWLSLKPGTFLRREPSKRLYLGLFRPTSDEISGLKKYWTLTKRVYRNNRILVGGGRPVYVARDRLNLVACERFTFVGLHEHRAAIRQRLLDMITVPAPKEFKWGKSDYIAVHIRLGDFQSTADESIIESGASNVRIPISWYVAVVKRLMRDHPDRPVYIFSDGLTSELQELLGLGAKRQKSGSDIGDLLALSSASILVGSNSSYSRWAAFLGDMPSIWTATSRQEEKASSHAPVAYLPLDNHDAISNQPLFNQSMLH